MDLDTLLESSNPTVGKDSGKLEERAVDTKMEVESGGQEDAEMKVTDKESSKDTMETQGEQVTLPSSKDSSNSSHFAIPNFQFSSKVSHRPPAPVIHKISIAPALGKVAEGWKKIENVSCKRAKTLARNRAHEKGKPPDNQEGGASRRKFFEILKNGDPEDESCLLIETNDACSQEFKMEEVDRSKEADQTQEVVEFINLPLWLWENLKDLGATLGTPLFVPS